MSPLLSTKALVFVSSGSVQLTKILVTPCVLFLQFVLYRKVPSAPKLLLAFVATVGVFLAVAAGASASMQGVLFAVAAVIPAALYKVTAERTLSGPDAGGADQLVAAVAPRCFAIALGAALVMEDVWGGLVTAATNTSILLLVVTWLFFCFVGA